MAEQRVREAMRWVAEAMGDGFAGVESFRVTEDGNVTVWLNDLPQHEGRYTRLHFALTDISTVTLEEFQKEYLGE